jgi:predicted thioredoxin/glutaredoxin
MIARVNTCSSGLPLISHDVGTNASADLIRSMMESDDANPLYDEFERIRDENPELMRSLFWLFEDQSDREQMVAVTAVAFAYKLLRAQAEVNELLRIGDGA